MDLAKHNQPGRRILGDEEFERRQAVERARLKSGTVVGSRVMDNPEEAAEKEKQAAEAQAEKEAEKQRQAEEAEKAKAAAAEKGDEGDSDPAVDPPANPFAADELPTVEATQELLSQRPELFDSALEAEVMSKGPRKGVLRHLLELEQARGEEARQNVVALIGAELEK